LIIGDGDLVDSLKAHISKSNAESYIKLLNPVPLERLPEYIERADAGIIPNRRSYSTDNFMLPVKLLEYLYMKKPIIAPKLSILERYFDESMLALFPAEDVNAMTEAICRLANDTNARSKLVENASRFISEHSWENQKKPYLKTLLNIEEKPIHEPA
jgi:glycosyltransferase involved in cell wall biosynthesis